MFHVRDTWVAECAHKDGIISAQVIVAARRHADPGAQILFCTVVIVNKFKFVPGYITACLQNLYGFGCNIDSDSITWNNRDSFGCHLKSTILPLRHEDT